MAGTGGVAELLPSIVSKRQLTGHRAVTLSAWSPHAAQHFGRRLRSARCTRSSAQDALISRSPLAGDCSRHQQSVSAGLLQALAACVEYQFYMTQPFVELYRSCMVVLKVS
jgi:hypothetical protein